MVRTLNDVDRQIWPKKNCTCFEPGLCDSSNLSSLSSPVARGRLWLCRPLHAALRPDVRRGRAAPAAPPAGCHPRELGLLENTTSTPTTTQRCGHLEWHLRVDSVPSTSSWAHRKTTRLSALGCAFNNNGFGERCHLLRAVVFVEQQQHVGKQVAGRRRATTKWQNDPPPRQRSENTGNWGDEQSRSFTLWFVFLLLRPAFLSVCVSPEGRRPPSGAHLRGDGGGEAQQAEAQPGAPGPEGGHRVQELPVQEILPRELLRDAAQRPLCSQGLSGMTRWLGHVNNSQHLCLHPLCFHFVAEGITGVGADVVEEQKGWPFRVTTTWFIYDNIYYIYYKHI